MPIDRAHRRLIGSQGASFPTKSLMITLVELKRLIALVVALASTPVTTATTATTATNSKQRYQVKEPYTPLINQQRLQFSEPLL